SARWIVLLGGRDRLFRVRLTKKGGTSPTWLIPVCRSTPTVRSPGPVRHCPWQRPAGAGIGSGGAQVDREGPELGDPHPTGKRGVYTPRERHHPGLTIPRSFWRPDAPVASASGKEVPQNACYQRRTTYQHRVWR